MQAIKATKLDNHVMIGGPIHSDAEGQNPNIASAGVQNQGQAPLVVYPAEVAAAAPAPCRCRDGKLQIVAVYWNRDLPVPIAVPDRMTRHNDCRKSTCARPL